MHRKLWLSAVMAARDEEAIRVGRKVPVFLRILNEQIMGTVPGHPRAPMLLAVGNADGRGDGVMQAGDVEAVAYQYCKQGVTVQAANDGCIVIAEGMAGSEDNFAAQMTERARQIGFKTSTFVNSTGLPADGQQTTVRDDYQELLSQYLALARTNHNACLLEGACLVGLYVSSQDGPDFFSRRLVVRA